MPYGLKKVGLELRRTFLLGPKKVGPNKKLFEILATHQK